MTQGPRIVLSLLRRGRRRGAAEGAFQATGVVAGKAPSARALPPSPTGKARNRIAFLALAASLFAAPALADGPPGASSCSGCHALSQKVDTAVPPLAGRPAADLAAAMRDFRSGARQQTVMARIAKGFTDAEIDVLSAWFAAQKAQP